MKIHKADKGFTLLELLISLTIVAVITVLIFSALRIGTRAWEKGEAGVEKRQRYRNVLCLMRQQLASVCLDGKKGDIFQGDEHFLEFVSRRALLPSHSSGMVYVRYQADAVRRNSEDFIDISLYEENMVFSGFFREEGIFSPRIDPDDYYELMGDMADFRFAYLKEEEGGQEEEKEKIWQSSWRQEEEGFPLAVKITYQPGMSAAPLSVIVPIRGGNPA